MLEWTAAGSGAHLCLFVHHTDAEREWAYDRKSRIGTLDKPWDEAIGKGWTVVEAERWLAPILNYDPARSLARGAAA